MDDNIEDDNSEVEDNEYKFWMCNLDFQYRSYQWNALPNTFPI